MNIIAELLSLGAREFVSVLAEQSVQIKAGLRVPSARSAISLGIAAIRKRWPELTQGNRGYEAARNVFRMQERRAQRAFNAMQNPDSPPPARPQTPPGQRPTRPPANQTYTLRVETISQRGARSSWMMVQVVGPPNMTMAELRNAAWTAVNATRDAGTTSGLLSASLGQLSRLGQVIWIG